MGSTRFLRWHRAGVARRRDGGRRLAPLAARFSGGIAPALRGGAMAVAALLLAEGGAAQEPGGSLMSEPIGYTAVADAFDEGDLLDANVHLAFRRSVASGTIQREVIDESSEDGRSSRHFVDVAEHEHDRNELVFQLELGLYHDLMLFVRMPVVLGDQRELTPADEPCTAGNASPGCRALLEPAPDGGSDIPLFDLSRTLRSGRRSGLPSVDLGIAWGVINQYRESHLATWVLLLESSIDTGQVVHACVGSGCEPGISSGTAKLRLESRWSYRYRYLEPFAGIAHTLQVITGGEKLYNPSGDLAGAVDPDPPSRTDATLGVAIIPWEDRGRFQRFEIDLKGSAGLISSGRDVSPLFDALGDSANAHLEADNFERLEPDAQVVPFTGPTSVQSHASLSLDAELVMQAARYVRFALGLGFAYATPHLITGAPACNDAVEAGSPDTRMGSCGPGIFNPQHRPAIDAPGRRFRLDGELTVRLLAAAVGQF
jgi:hypothetical protein